MRWFGDERSVRQLCARQGDRDRARGYGDTAAFLFFGLNYAALLGVLVGISVLIPFIGAASVTLPVFMIAVLQFDWS